MSIKNKLLAGLSCTIDDLSEDTLVQALLDAYAAAKRKIAELEGANAREFQALFDERNKLIQEQRRLREDPLYAVAGEYFFADRTGRYFYVHIQGYRVTMFERRWSVDHALQSMTPGEFAGSTIPRG